MVGALRLLGIVITLPVSALALGYLIAPPGDPSLSEACVMLAALALGLTGLGWVRWQTGALWREMAVWVLAFRVLCAIVPADPVGLVALVAAALARFGAAAFRPRPFAWPSLTLVALGVLSGVAIHRADATRAPGGDSGACYADGSSGVAVLGDSSTYGMFVPIADRYSRRIGATNCAFAGAPSSALAGQLAAAGAVDVLVVYVGPNDRYVDGWRDRLRSNLTATVHNRRAVLVTYPHGAAIRPAWLHDLNAIVREVATAEGATLVDAAEVMRDPWDFLVDGIHPSARGHRRLAALISRAI